MTFFGWRENYDLLTGHRTPAPRPRSSLHRSNDLRHDPLLPSLVRGQISLRRTRELGTPAVTHDERIARRHTKTRRNKRPRSHVLRLCLCPHDFLDRRIQIDNLLDLRVRPRIELLDTHKRYMRRATSKQIIVDLARAEHETLHILARIRNCRIIDH